MKQIQIFPSITTIDSHSLKSYLNEVSRIPCLTPEEEANLASLILEGGKEGRLAKERLVVANLRFVISIAKMYQHAGMLLEDLINEGNIGLIRAAERFDPTRGFKFASFAVWWIRQAILAFLADKSRMVRLPLNVTNILSRLRAAANAFEQENQRTPSSAELAERTGMSVEKVEEYLGHTTSTISMDTPLSADSDATVGEMLPDTSSDAADEKLMAESLRHDLQVAMSSVTRREQEIIRMYYGLDGEARSMDEIAMEYHLTRERVRQLIDRGVSTIRQIHGEALRKYT